MTTLPPSTTPSLLTLLPPGIQTTLKPENTLPGPKTFPDSTETVIWTSVFIIYFVLFLGVKYNQLQRAKDSMGTPRNLYLERSNKALPQYSQISFARYLQGAFLNPLFLWAPSDHSLKIENRNKIQKKALQLWYKPKGWLLNPYIHLILITGILLIVVGKRRQKILKEEAEKMGTVAPSGLHGLTIAGILVLLFLVVWTLFLWWYSSRRVYDFGDYLPVEPSEDSSSFRSSRSSGYEGDASSSSYSSN
jgi:hypothetical protein